MKRLLIVLAVALLVPVAASADPIAVGDIVTVSDPGSRFGSGGPFQITKAGETPFLTFCIETNEYFNWGAYRVARIDTVAILGGAGGGSPDPLNYETAWLYTQFRGLTGAQQTAQGGMYQEAIWFFEQEAGGANNAGNTLVEDAVAGGWTNLGNVRVLGFDAENGGVQDMLVLVPEPGSMMLLGTGLVGLAGALRRRLRK